MQEKIEISIESDYKTICKIFEDAEISRFFKKSIRETDTLIRGLILDYEDELLMKIKDKRIKKMIPTDKEKIFSEFLNVLKGLILSNAIVEVIQYHKFDVKKNILYSIEPIMIIQFYPKALEQAFINTMNENISASDDDNYDSCNISMLS